MPSGHAPRYYFAALLAVTLLTAGCLSDTAPGGSDSVPPVSSPSGNTPPTISGSPVTAVLIGDVYAFRPSATDSDGDSLAFSIENKPRWAEFDTATGRLSGSVALGDEGLYTGVTISVSDGETTRALPAFSITVSQTADGSMSLSWTAPTENTDGSVLTDLAGYRIYYGESPGNYTKSIRIDNPGITTYVVDNLLPTTYYIVATSFNTDGVESAYSNMAVKLINP